jgi:hypothetical protein
MFGRVKSVPRSYIGILGRKVRLQQTVSASTPGIEPETGKKLVQSCQLPREVTDSV